MSHVLSSSSLIPPPSSLDTDSQLIQLRRVHRRRRLAHEVLRPCRLRECDDLAERLAARHQHHDAVEAEGDAAVRRGAVAKGFQEKAEAFAGFIVADSERT